MPCSRAHKHVFARNPGVFVSRIDSVHNCSRGGKSVFVSTRTFVNNSVVVHKFTMNPSENVFVNM